MKKNSPIGFFDSGIGGLSVFSRFKKVLPYENTLYFGDLKNLPYGNKSKEELIGFARNILDFFKSKNIKAVIIACNTSSAQAYETIKNEYNFEIYPIIQSCAKVIAKTEGLKKIGVFATEATINSKVYTKELQKYNSEIEVYEIACPKWVQIVEQNLNDENDIKAQLDEMLKFNPDKIILGCTHYPYLLETLSKFVIKEKFIDPAEIFVNYIKQDLKEKNLLNENAKIPTEKFFVSSAPQDFIKNAKLFYEVPNVILF